jgi:hypothetical protein
MFEVWHSIKVVAVSFRFMEARDDQKHIALSVAGLHGIGRYQRQ